MLIFISILSYAQTTADYGIEFSKFKLEWYTVMGFRGGDSQRLKLTFKNTSDKDLKYVFVKYYAVNAVNDISVDNYNRKEFSVSCTGPYKSGVTKKLEVEIALFFPNLLKAYPYELNLTYMNGTEQDIVINKDNIKTLFPCLDYIEIGNLQK
nr:hypothetical protein [uncultured Bacteroides sp.]